MNKFRKLSKTNKRVEESLSLKNQKNKNPFMSIESNGEVLNLENNKQGDRKASLDSNDGF